MLRSVTAWPKTYREGQGKASASELPYGGSLLLWQQRGSTAEAAYRGMFGVRVIFPHRGLLSILAYFTGQQIRICKPFKNSMLFFCPANPFMDTSPGIS